MKKSADTSSGDEFSESDEEYRPLHPKRRTRPKFVREKPKSTDNKVVHVSSFLLGTTLMAPFMVLIISAEDMLSGTKQATGLVIIAATAPSFLIKFCFLLSEKLRNTSAVVKTLFAYVVIVAGMLCVAFSQIDFKIRFVGVCLVSLGLSVGEIGLLLIATTKLRDERALSSLIVGSAVGGILSTIPYVAMTSWSRINPRAALLVPIIWPSLYLLTFAAGQLKNLGKKTDIKILEVEGSGPLNKHKNLFVKRILAVWKVLKHLLFLYVSHFSTFLCMGAVVTTLVYSHSKFFGPREDYHHYVLCFVIGQFFGRSLMSLLVAKFPDIRSTIFQALGIFFTTFIMVLFVLGSFNRFINHVWTVFGMCFVQGTLLGILTIVSYHTIANLTRKPHMQFLIVFASLMETFGMLCAGLIGLHTEPSLYKRCLEENFGNSSLCLTRNSNTAFWMKGKNLLM